MPTILRNGRTISVQDTQEKTIPQPTSRPMPAPSRLRPSTYLLLIYPFILALGSLFSMLSPIAFSNPVEPLAAGITSDLNTPHFHPTNYFAGKRNLVNLYFVKIGWFWTTLAFTLLQATTRPAQPRKHYLQSALRYGLVTLSWFLTTQWFFGPALIDRSFTITGGHCEPFIHNATDLKSAMDMTRLTTGSACKAAGGRWYGGYDISGHVFMLVLSSAFLLYEMHICDRDSLHPSVSPRAAAALAHDMTEEERRAVGGWETELQARLRVWSRYFVYLVVGLDLWMLLMTAIWFHTWIEKLAGLLIAWATVHGTYFVGDVVPVWRGVVGGF